MRYRKIACALAFTMLMTCCAACGKSPVTDETVTKDTLTVATMSETPSVGPFDHNAVAGSYVNSLVFATLFRTDKNLEPQPWLVESFENPDGSTWILHLLPDVKFHDGSIMTSADVVASLDFAKTAPEISFYTASVKSVEAVDEKTVKITTPGPAPTLLYDLAHHGNAIVPKALLDSGNNFGKNPIGAGPYVYKNWVLGDRLEFEAFADYFEGAPKIKNIVWKTIPEGSSRTIALEAGEVDMVIEVEGIDVERLSGSTKVKVLNQTATGVSWLILNNEKAPFDNAEVRHAINSAINKENVVLVALNKIGTPLKSQVPSGLLGSDDSGADDYDIVRAKKYLEMSGVDPATVKMSIICSSDQKKRAAEVIQSDLAQIGIATQVESMDLATYLTSTAEGNFTASIGGYSSTELVTYLTGVFHSKSIGASNKARLNSPEINALIDKAAATVDNLEREKILKECVAKLNQLCPQIPLWQDIAVRAYNANLKNVEMNAIGEIPFEKISW